MKIGELARRTGVAPRLLRYYEQQGLITARRADNGYREYSEDDAAQVERVVGLVRAGMPSRLVRVVLDIEGIASVEVAAVIGAMMFVVVEELIPESQSGENTDIGTMAFLGGFTIMMILDVALG